MGLGFRSSAQSMVLTTAKGAGLPVASTVLNICTLPFHSWMASIYSWVD